MVHLAGNYTLAVSAADYYSITRPGVVVAEGGIEEQDIKLILLSPTSPPSGAGGGGGGGCSIATAAYGSYIEKHVTVLREFRDRFMINNLVGKAFINLYNTYSTPVADFIANHDTVRLVVRWSLLPLVGVSWITLQLGPWITLALIGMLICFMGAGATIALRRMRLRRQS